MHSGRAKSARATSTEPPECLRYCHIHAVWCWKHSLAQPKCALCFGACDTGCICSRHWSIYGLSTGPTISWKFCVCGGRFSRYVGPCSCWTRVWAGTPWAVPCPARTLRTPVLFFGPNSLAATRRCDVWWSEIGMLMLSGGSLVSLRVCSWRHIIFSIAISAQNVVASWSGNKLFSVVITPQ